MLRRFFATTGIAMGLFGLIFFGLNASYFVKLLSYSVAPTPSSPESLPEMQAPEELHLPPNTLAIPTLNIEAPITFPTSASETAYQAALVDGVALFPGTALPGEPGRSYIFGHSSDVPWSKGHFKTIFALLPNITPSMPIYLSNVEGNLFTCSVTGTAIIKPTDTSITEQPNASVRELVLQTSYPIGTAFRRFVVFSTCEEAPTEPKEAVQAP